MQILFIGGNQWKKRPCRAEILTEDGTFLYSEFWKGNTKGLQITSNFTEESAGNLDDPNHTIDQRNEENYDIGNRNPIQEARSQLDILSSLNGEKY